MKNNPYAVALSVGFDGLDTGSSVRRFSRYAASAFPGFRCCCL
jgi:hypothetical protein